MRMNTILWLSAASVLAVSGSSYAQQEKPAGDSAADRRSAAAQLQNEKDETTIDLSGIWIDRDDLSTGGPWYKFSIDGDQLVITTGQAYSISDHVFAWAKLVGRAFTGTMNSSPGASGDSFVPMRIQGTISAGNEQVDMIVSYQKGAPGTYRLVRRK